MPSPSTPRRSSRCSRRGHPVPCRAGRCRCVARGNTRPGPSWAARGRPGSSPGWSWPTPGFSTIGPSSCRPRAPSPSTSRSPSRRWWPRIARSWRTATPTRSARPVASPRLAGGAWPGCRAWRGWTGRRFPGASPRGSWRRSCGPACPNPSGGSPGSSAPRGGSPSRSPTACTCGASGTWGFPSSPRCPVRATTSSTPACRAPGSSGMGRSPGGRRVRLRLRADQVTTAISPPRANPVARRSSSPLQNSPGS